MKKAAILLMTEVHRRKLDVLKVLDIHDEFQFDVHKDCVDEFIECCHGAFRRAGEYFNYHLPIACDAKVGETWSQTH